MRGDFDPDRVRQQTAFLAKNGLYPGSSSWKYRGWVNQLYDPARYLHRGRFSTGRFNQLCLAEYAAVFPTVCVDAAYYQFPNPHSIQALVDLVPPHFQFAFKVTSDITVKRFPKLDRFGARAGQINPAFLDPDLFIRAFLRPLEPFRPHIGLLIFEFSRFHPTDFARGRDFVAALDRFLDRLPADWPYGIEIRNRTFLHPDYFATLTRHRVTHVFNNWEAMPDIADQLDLPGSLTHPGRVAARFLLRSGRRYQQAVDSFAPYARLQDPNPAGRAAAVRILREALATRGGRQVFLYVNNRFEGNAPGTLQAILDQALRSESES